MSERHLSEVITLWKACEEDDFLATHPHPLLLGLGEMDAALLRTAQQPGTTLYLAYPQDASSEARAAGAYVGVIFEVAGKSGPEQKEILIGRSPFCDIHLDDPAISELHCQLEKEGDGFAVNDQGSTNGTMINGQTLEPGSPRLLQNEDVLTVGRLSFKFFTPRVLYQYVRLGLLGGDEG